MIWDNSTSDAVNTDKNQSAATISFFTDSAVGLSLGSEAPGHAWHPSARPWACQRQFLSKWTLHTDGHRAPVELHLDATTIDVYGVAAPIDMCRDAASTDVRKDAKPIDVHTHATTQRLLTCAESQRAAHALRLRPNSGFTRSEAPFITPGAKGEKKFN